MSLVYSAIFAINDANSAKEVIQLIDNMDLYDQTKSNGVYGKGFIIDTDNVPSKYIFLDPDYMYSDYSSTFMIHLGKYIGIDNNIIKFSQKNIYMDAYIQVLKIPIIPENYRIAKTNFNSLSKLCNNVSYLYEKFDDIHSTWYFKAKDASILFYLNDQHSDLIENIVYHYTEIISPSSFETTNLGKFKNMRITYNSVEKNYQPAYDFENASITMVPSSDVYDTSIYALMSTDIRKKISESREYKDLFEPLDAYINDNINNINNDSNNITTIKDNPRKLYEAFRYNDKYEYYQIANVDEISNDDDENNKKTKITKYI
jgi:hypothetical protein